MRYIIAGFVLLTLGIFIATAGVSGTTQAPTKGQAMATAIFGAGCFWGVEDAFRHVDGVTSTRVGYAGGTTESPTYEDVCAGRTGHTEVVEVTYDPDIVAYAKLLDVFWSIHEPTLKHKAQYKSVIFYTTDDQREAATAAQAQREQAGGRPLATDILPAPTFYPAEDYHQQYYERRGMSGGCG